MVARRLLIILVIFIVIGGLAIAGGQIFVVRHIDPTFANMRDYISDYDESTIQQSIRDELGFVRGRSILFSVDRDRIISTIEDVDHRVRVTNVEAIFPNRLRITLRERYAVFAFSHGGYDMVLDSQLRFVTEQANVSSQLIDINGQIQIPGNQTPVPGMFMYEFFQGDYYNAHQLMRIARLSELSELFFWQQGMAEDSKVHLFEEFEFQHGGTELFLRFRDDVHTSIRIRGIENSALFLEKIELIWDVMELVEQEAYHYIAEVRNGQVRVIGPGGPI
ncbi:MAG: FtsQ-type POTRA domain-containing protein [Firmicutes bacterium]|nr:FtsQ-type POTRA domain-containing protein [Bacillota bacterium]